MGKSLLDRLRVSDDHIRGYATDKWINPDIAPLPPSRRVWGIWAYIGWGSIASICISAWTAAASLLSLGLSMGETVGVMILSRILIVSLIIANGWMGADWHIGFSVAQRMIMGMQGAYITQAMRIMLSIVWYGSQAWLGGLCVSAMLSSWSYNFLMMKNTLPESAHMVTRDLVGFVLFHILSVPFLFIKPEKAKGYVIAANIVVLLIMMSITIWSCTTAGGAGPFFNAGYRQINPTLSTAWAWVYGIIATVGGIAAGIVNQSDFTRFARKQGVQVPGMAISTLIFGMVVPFFAMLSASASLQIWPELEAPMWNPLSIVFQWMIDDYSAKARAGAFFCSFGFVFGQIAENIMGNGYAAGMDLAGLFPNWISIRRGTLLCALLSWAVCPWEFYNTASTFVAVAASFSVFLGPLTGIMLADYWIVRRQKIQISQLYTGSPEGSYWYTFGFNWRAIISWFVGFAPAMPGMIASVNLTVTVNQGVLNYYRGNYLFGFAMAGGLYVILCLISKPKGAGQQDEEDIYGTFEEDAAIKRGITPWEAPKRLGMAEDPAAVTIVDDAAVKHADSARPAV